MSTPPRVREPRLAGFVSWLVLGASFGLSASTWVSLAVMAGFTGTLAGVLPLAWLMPVAIDGYVVVSLVTWMSPVPAHVARFARTNTYAAALIGVAAQSSFHALTIWTFTGVMWQAVLAAIVGALPPAVAGLAVHMRALIRRHSGRAVSAPVSTPAMPAAQDVAPDMRPVSAPVRTDSALTESTGAMPIVTADQPASDVQLTPDEAKETAIALRAMYPDMPRATIGARIGRSVKTVGRYLGEASDPRPTSPGPVNGHRALALEGVIASHRADN